MAWKHLRLSLLAVLCALALWAIATEGGFVEKKFLPSPSDIAGQAVVLVGQGYIGTPLHRHVLASLGRTFVGFVVGAVLAVPLGLALGYSERLNAVVTPFLSALRPIPVIAYIPLVILWFGIGEFSKILLIALTSFLYITVNAAAGVRSVAADLIRAAQSLGVNERQLFLHVILPESLPYIFAGLRIGAAVSWAVVVAAELVAAQSGLGYMIMDAATFFRIPVVYVGIILIGLIGFAIERVIATLERRFVHWSNR
jgi:ABC-type nitrate/sulfonate/bicarbonate transport system permease component